MLTVAATSGIMLIGPYLVMTYHDALVIIRECLDAKLYRVVYKYTPNIPFVFVFESKCVQYDPIDILYLNKYPNTTKLPPLNQMIRQLELSTTDAIVLFQLSNGAYLKIKDKVWREEYDERRKQLREITGINA